MLLENNLLRQKNNLKQYKTLRVEIITTILFFMINTRLL